MEPTETRFAHLLQPIRDLTKNWEINVASELNDYLEELDEMCITFDDGKITLNFAEAALLIQGSACIYSKKVELLHSLVYQTLEHINEKNKKRNKQRAQPQDDAAAESSCDDGDDAAEFIPVDIEASEITTNVQNNKFVEVIPLLPESLMLPETHEKQKLPLISVKGEVLCSQKDFRINLFFPGEDDLLLVTHRSAASTLVTDRGPDPAEPLQQHQDADAAVGVAEGGGGDAEENFFPLEDDNMDVDQAPEEHVDRHQASREGRLVQERRVVEGDKQAPAVDVWAHQDRYAVVGTDKPFKSGKVYKLPYGLDDNGKRKRPRCASLQDFRSWLAETTKPKYKFKLTFPDFNYIYVKRMKEKLEIQKKINKKAGVAVPDEELRRNHLQPEDEEEEPVDGLGPFDLLGEDDIDNELDVFPDGDPAQADERPPYIILAEALTDEMAYEDLVQRHVDQLVASCRGYSQETALSQRVKKWEDVIRPELDLQELRPPFDIHEYGDKLMEALKGVGQRRTFSSIVHGLDNMEACRYLLASLQLANDYTVEVDSLQGLENSLDSMGLTLLSTKKAADRFKALSSETGAHSADV
ncbi:condensin-2 complex subunit H2 [Mastacembelus armatus]|uniref:Condensin-2 complex subunit H2 n=1 Tax=Mastacembelus armatus TaxID=205130 RepID=A0A3Q3NES4_9TELE|nr:condensin-2 complex subunit H2 [Mastacembelus armatus]